MKDRLLYPCNCSGSSDDGVNVKCNNTNIASLSVGLRQVTQLFVYAEYNALIYIKAIQYFLHHNFSFSNYRFVH